MSISGTLIRKCCQHLVFIAYLPHMISINFSMNDSMYHDNNIDNYIRIYGNFTTFKSILKLYFYQ